MGFQINIRRKVLFEDLLGLDPVGPFRQKTQPPCDAMDMRVDGKSGDPAGKKKDTGGGFRPDPPDGREGSHSLLAGDTLKIREGFPSVRKSPFQELPDGSSPCCPKPCRGDDGFQFPRRGSEDVLPAWITFFQGIKGEIPVPVAGVLGKDRLYEFVKDREPRRRGRFLSLIHI